MAALTTYEDVDVGDEFNVNFIIVCRDVLPHALPAGRECLTRSHTPHTTLATNITLTIQLLGTTPLNLFCSFLNVSI